MRVRIAEPMTRWVWGPERCTTRRDPPHIGDVHQTQTARRAIMSVLSSPDNCSRPAPAALGQKR